MNLWNKSSGIISDFTTNFSFSIDPQNNTRNADGFAFFIASPQYRMPDKNQGSGLGLASGNLTLNSTANPFVAVEFDTYYNPWDDIDTAHVGIVVNSLKSLKSFKWYNSIFDGRIMNATIKYSSSSKNLCVYFTGVTENITFEQKFCHEIDLRYYLPERVVVGFSSATGSFSELHQIHSWSFSSSFQTHQKITSFFPLPPIPNPHENDKNRAALIAGPVNAAFVLIVIILGGLIWHYKKRRSKRDGETEVLIVNSEDKELKSVTGSKKIPHHLLAHATNNFDEKEKLGEGGFGAVFKGYLQDLNTYVAVKRISENSTQGISEYTAEVMILSQLKHRNLVQLIGWCHETKEILLVYEYIPNGSLDFHLFGRESLLKWEQRYKIAQGLACGLQYLHEGWRQCVLHRDIKSSNVMLDADFNPVIGDFGLARLVDHDARSLTLHGGSHGYMAPECHETGKSSKESDVFSFGVVALEIACGRKPFVQRVDGSHVHIVKWVWELYGSGELLKAADEKLQGKFTEKQMECLILAGMWCAHPDHKLMPSMREAINVLHFDAQIPVLPSKYPGTLHFVADHNVSFKTAPAINSSYNFSKLTYPTSPLIFHV